MRERLRGVGLLALRLTTGWILATHGWGKVADPEGFVGGLERAGYPMPELLGQLAAWSEFAGGLMLILGLFTPLAAFFAAGTMAVAAFYHHLWRGWGNWSAEDGPVGFLEKLASTRWEFALAVLGGCLCLLFVGPGRYSIDGLILGAFKKKEPEPAEPSSPKEPEGASSMPLPDLGEGEPEEDDDEPSPLA